MGRSCPQTTRASSRATSCGFSEAEAGCEAALDRASPQPPCGLRLGPREAARVRGESSGRLPWVEVGQQFLAGVEAEPE